MKASSKRRLLVNRDGPYCFYCQRVLRMPGPYIHDLEEWEKRGYIYATIDHLLPRSLGGTHDLDNLVLACPKCHRKRHERDGRIWE